MSLDKLGFSVLEASMIGTTPVWPSVLKGAKSEDIWNRSQKALWYVQRYLELQRRVSGGLQWWKMVDKEGGSRKDEEFRKLSLGRVR